MAIGLGIYYLRPINYQFRLCSELAFFVRPLMSRAKNGSKKSAKRPSRKRKGMGTHVIDYQPESPVIREHEAVERRRRGFRTAM